MNEPQVLSPTSASISAIPALDPVPESRASKDEATVAVPRPRKKGTTTYDRVLESIAHVTTLVAAGALWWIGAQFTLSFLKLLHVPVDFLSLGQWLIPAGITAIEIKYWPRKGLNRNLIIMFLIIAGVDLLTSLIGGKEWLAGRVVGSYTIPDTKWLWAVALVGACFSAFWPEKLSRAAIAELRKIWNI